MATTSKLIGLNGFYGYDSYSNSAANHLYIGKQSTTYNYRSRLTFKPLSSIAAIGSSRIRVTKVLLYIRRNDGGPTTITVGCSSSGSWGASLKATKSASIAATTQWYSIDITNMASAIGAFTSNWYLHFTGNSPRLRCNGTASDYIPYIKVTWEYVAATISSDSDEAELGSTVNFTIVPEVSGETHTLTYSLGDASGTIATKAGDAIPWTPPLSLATAIPDAESGQALIQMTVYNSAGAVIRTEVYYQTVTVPESVAPVIPSDGLAISLVRGLSWCALAGETSLSIVPKVDMTGAMGATIKALSATVTNGDSAQTIAWTALSEDAGVFTGAAAQTAALASAGTAEVVLTATDSRGRSASRSASVTVCEYSRPVVALFAVERYEPVYDENEQISGYQASDLGGYVWVNLQAAVSEIAPDGVQLNSLSWEIRETLENGAVNVYTGSGAQSVSLVQDRSVIPGAVGQGETRQYALTVTDSAGFTAVQYDAVAPGRANLSLAASKYGVGVGCIARGTQENPLFECAYPAQFGEGIFGHGGLRVDAAAKAYAVPDSDIASGFAVYADAWRPIVARAGALVTITGIMKASVATASASGIYTLFTLPEWARPAQDVHALMQGSSTNLYWLRITAAGAVMVQRYRNSASNAVIPAGAQLTMHAAWIAADAITA